MWRLKTLVRNTGCLKMSSIAFLFRETRNIKEIRCELDKLLTMTVSGFKPADVSAALSSSETE